MAFFVKARSNQTRCGSNLVVGVARGGRAWEAHVHAQPGGCVLVGVYLSETVELTRYGVLGVRDEDLHTLPLGGDGVVDPLQQSLAALNGAYHHGLWILPAQLLGPPGRDQVHLVQAQDGPRLLLSGTVGAASQGLHEGAPHGLDLSLQFGATGV